MGAQQIQGELERNKIIWPRSEQAALQEGTQKMKTDPLEVHEESTKGNGNKWQNGHCLEITGALFSPEAYSASGRRAQ